MNLDDNAPSLKSEIGAALDYMLPELEAEPPETFWYYQARLKTNFKLIHNTNSEFYHDCLHVYNRITGMLKPDSGYFHRRYTLFPGGHASVGSVTVSYDSYKATGRSELGWPHLAPKGWKLVDLFPCITFNLRTSVLRIDGYIPLAPNDVILEFRALGLKSDTPEIRRQREMDAAVIWSPFGRKFHEDLLASSGRGIAVAKGSQPMYGLQAREEDATIHDEVGMRHHLAEWSGAWDEAPRIRTRPSASVRAPPGEDTMTVNRIEVEELVCGTCLRLDDKDWKGFLALCDEKFNYKVTAYAPEIRNDMTWLDRDRAEVEEFIGMLPKHNTHPNPLTRHAQVWKVKVAAYRAKVVSSLQIYRTALNGGATERFAVGKHYDTVALDGGQPRLLARHVELDTRDLDWGTHLPL